MEQAIPSWLARHIVQGPNCWQWTGPVLKRYGGNGGDRAYAAHNGRSTTAARALWTAVYGEIPHGLLVLHACDNPMCVRPDHLHLGTPRQNSQEAVLRGRMRPHGKRVA